MHISDFHIFVDHFKSLWVAWAHSCLKTLHDLVSGNLHDLNQLELLIHLVIGVFELLKVAVVKLEANFFSDSAINDHGLAKHIEFIRLSNFSIYNIYEILVNFQDIHDSWIIQVDNP